MNLMIQPNQICLIVKLYNNRPKLLPDSNEPKSKYIKKKTKPNGWAINLAQKALSLTKTLDR